MGAIFSPPRAPAPAPPPPVYTPPPMPTVDDSEVKEAEEKRKRAATLAKGRASTILTGGLGLTDQATTSQKTLLGQ